MQRAYPNIELTDGAEGGLRSIRILRKARGRGAQRQLEPSAEAHEFGLTPQSVQEFGGFKVQGRTEEAARKLLRDARAIAKAGVFAIVVESVPPKLAARITAAVKVPTIGIGAGPQCDGQVLVIHDLLGLGGDWKPKFAKRYADLGAAARTAIGAYKREVATGKFPGPEHCY